MFKTGDAVEVFRPNQNEWVCGKVMERRIHEDGTAIYYVQLAGYAASAPDDPNVWFTDKLMRSASSLAHA